MSELAPRRVKFVRASLERVADQCLAKVELSGPGKGSYVGTAMGGRRHEDTLRASAQATAEALNQAVGEPRRIEVQQVDLFDAFGRSAVLVHIEAELHHRTEALTGFCMEGRDPARAAALAVLNATNRALDIG